MNNYREHSVVLRYVTPCWTGYYLQQYSRQHQYHHQFNADSTVHYRTAQLMVEECKEN